LSEEEFEWHGVKSECKKKEEETNDDAQRKCMLVRVWMKRELWGVNLLKIKS
jgi:hypothetical protein